MEKYQNFNLAGYVYAYYLDGITEEKLRRDIAFYEYYLPLTKVYLESHRALVDIPEETLRMAKRVFLEKGIEVSGGITTTAKVGEKKPSIFDCYCFSDEAHRENLLSIVRKTASLFDEFILDDYFFTPCRCEKCIKAKGSRSWERFRLDTMADFSRELVTEAKKANPKCSCIIKYPNWYESYAETGYNPEAQKDIFDRIYTGTESRLSNYNAQHLQRYLSYSLMRLMENSAPGRNGGGWIDLGGSSGNVSVFLQQAELTLFSKARELMLFNFGSMIDEPAAAALGIALQKADVLLGKLGNPLGVSVYEPYASGGEDQLINYIGMLGIPLEPKPYFDEEAKEVFLTENSAKDPDVVKKLEKYVREGGIAVITSGFLKAAEGMGIRQLTSARVTGRKLSGTRFALTNLNVSSGNTVMTDEKVSFTELAHKNNATWEDVLLFSNDTSMGILTEDYYGKGFLYILDIPDNFGDLYRLPKEVIGAIGKDFARGGSLYLSAPAPMNLFRYDNGVFGVYNLNAFKQDAEIILLGEDILGFEDIETGARFTEPDHILPRPHRKGDSAAFIEEPVEKAFKLPVWPGRYRFFRLIRG